MKTTMKSLLVLALAGFVFTGCATQKSCKTTEWEYTTLQMVPLPSNDKTLNGYGKQGWSLVSVAPLKQDGGVGECSYIFRRPKQ
jgi:uncharacterized lipoprotein YajG